VVLGTSLLPLARKLDFALGIAFLCYFGDANDESAIMQLFW